jgi:hypothetical protein
MAELPLSERVASLATLQFSIVEISAATGVSVDVLRDTSTPEGAAVKKGRFEAKVAIRSAVLKSAREGNDAAMKRFLELITKRENVERAIPSAAAPKEFPDPQWP